MPAGKLFRMKPKGKKRGKRYAGGFKGYGYRPSRWIASVSVAPDKMWTKLRYVESVTLAAAGTVDGRVFRLNGPGDPNSTAPLVGLQPTGYDQWANIYQRYWVTKSMISIRAAPVEASTGGFANTNFALFPSAVGVIPSVMDTALSRNRVKTLLLNKESGVKRLSHKATTKSITGNKWNVEQTADATSPATPFPIEQAYWVFLMQPLDQLTPTSVDLQITIDYDVMWYNRRPIEDEPPVPI